MMKMLPVAVRLDSPRVSGPRDALWCEARHFFSRTDAGSTCWLWLLLADGRVQALRLPGAVHGRIELALPLAERLARSRNEQLAAEEGGPAWLLRAAPVVPLPRWAISWGHPVQRAIRCFASKLDERVLDALGALEIPGAFYGSVANYNRLASLPEPQRTHRLQALARFPALVAPLLLEHHEGPELFGSDARGRLTCPAPGGRHAGAALEAMDRGRDLVGALAACWQIDRALVRSPLLASPWGEPSMVAELLPLFQALPAHARPRSWEEVKPWLPALRALPVRLHRKGHCGPLARTFHSGWAASWEAMQQRSRLSLGHAFRDSRDFLAAVLAQVEPPPGLAGLDVEALGLAWLARRGGVSLLEASQRWHERPLVELPGETAPKLLEVAPIFGEFSSPLGRAREILDRRTLVAEGETMRHCVGEYWEDCLTEAARIVHLESASGGRATAMYVPIDAGLDEPVFVLDQLRGPGNAEPAGPLVELAEEVHELLNLPVHAQARAAVVAAARRQAELLDHDGMPRSVRWLDLRSREEARVVLDWCVQEPLWQQRTRVLFCGMVAGLGYTQAQRFLAEMHAGERLQLVREPANPHDPRAVRVDWRGRKIGYVPRASNGAIAQLMDAGRMPEARIRAVHPGASTWEAVEFEVLPAPG